MTIIGLIVGAAILALGPSGNAAGNLPRPDQPIRVLETTHEVRFPSEVVFQLEAEGDESITEVTLYYNVSGGRVTTYGYPSFSPAKQITAGFTIETDGSSYLPTGADIEYHYQIRDALGRSLETPPLTLEYRDPRYEWQTLQRGSMKFLWHDRPVEQVARVSDVVAERLNEVREVLGLDADPQMKAVIINDAREAQRSFPSVSGTATQTHLYSGFAFREYDLFVLAGLHTDGIVHEATHLMLDEAASSPLVRVPSWLHEGLATYFESSSNRRERSLAQAARSSALMPLSHMIRQPGRPSEVRVFYDQSWGVVNYLMSTYDPDQMTTLIEAMGSGRNLDESLWWAYGLTLDDLDEQWKASLLGNTPVAPRPDPGTLVTNSLIGAAVAVALTVVGLKWLRNLLAPSVSHDSAG